ncbi:MAG: hypothetical protein Q4B29_02695 [Candidatus Saccharibacteria bacterium]|nr:hypothetical protein [Candidatus Saccharibacteria bacterium]
MFNSLYHKFIPGFNLWYVVAPVLIILVALACSKRYYLLEDLRIRSRFNDRCIKVMATIASVIFGVLFALESRRGILQMCDNSLTDRDNPIYSGIIALMIYVAVVAIYGVATFYIGRYVSKRRLRSVKRLRRAVRERIEME